MKVCRSRLAVFFTASLAPIIISSNDAWSASLCKAIALRDVAAIEAPDSVLPRGSYDHAVTQYIVNKQTGMTTLCSHGGYCYPTHVRVNGQKVEAFRLTNCKIGSRIYEGLTWLRACAREERSRASIVWTPFPFVGC